MSNHSLDFPPFNTLPDNVIKDLETKLTLKIYPKDTFVFQQGDPSLGYLIIILSGTAGIAVESEKGIPDVIGLRRKGDFFGETVLLTGKTYPVSVKAVEDLTCLLLEKESFEILLQNHKEFAGFFNHILTDRLRNLYEQMVREQPFDASGLSSEPFKYRVKDIMSSPIETCSPNMPVSQIARILAQKRISSVVITGINGKILGLVSERDLISKVLALDCNPAVVTAVDIMEKNPATIHPDAFFYQCLLTMINHQAKYILVIEQGFPVGIVTMGDLTRARKTSMLAIVNRILSAKNIEEIADVSRLIQKVIVNMVTEKAPSNEICEVVSELNDHLTRRLLVLAEENLLQRGFGHPPVDYCWLVLGSGGRKEQTLSSDQDNAVIYADSNSVSEQTIENYFSALAEFVVEGLEKAGFSRCPHNIMAINPAWRHSLSIWKKIGHEWVFSPSVESFRQFTIFLDYRTVFGQENLAQELRDFAYRLFRLAPAILHHLAKDDLQTRVPLGLFKQILVERKNKAHKDEVDLKRSALIHIVDCIRIFALREGIQETSTLARLNKLVQLEVISLDDAEYFEAAYQSLMMFRIQGNLQKISLARPPDNYLNPHTLTKRQQSLLRESFTAVERLQTLTGTSFRVEGYV